ncbi:hypothetical protein J1605_013003 [Eschrichtius robustus]|uniref:Uncharacterized protein n=1 Tax=Eschrichtius robustus TaxID=9764 RepID=A0AB34GJE2_ESCRO|nr:hypothetical protein J1605_013003 [Eschrichtius robustus]
MSLVREDLGREVQVEPEFALASGRRWTERPSACACRPEPQFSPKSRCGLVEAAGAGAQAGPGRQPHAAQAGHGRYLPWASAPEPEQELELTARPTSWWIMAEEELAPMWPRPPPQGILAPRSGDPEEHDPWAIGRKQPEAAEATWTAFPIPLGLERWTKVRGQSASDAGSWALAWLCRVGMGVGVGVVARGHPGDNRLSWERKQPVSGV